MEKPKYAIKQNLKKEFEQRVDNIDDPEQDYFDVNKNSNKLKLSSRCNWHKSFNKENPY